MHKILLLILVLAFLIMGRPAFADLPKPPHPLWKPIVDKVYLQEVASHIKTKRPITAVAVYNGQAFAGDEKGVYAVDGEKLKRLDVRIHDVTGLKALGDNLWAASPGGLWKYDGKKWTQVTKRPVADMCLYNGKVILASDKTLYAVDGSKVALFADGAPGKLLGVASYAGTVYVHDGKQVGLVVNGKITYDDTADWGTLQRGCTVRDIMSYGSRLYVATNKGLGLLRGMSWYHIEGKDGLCYHDTTCLAKGFNRDLWIGSMRGAIRNVNGEYQYFGCPRWIPNDKVNAVASGKDIVYIATDSGLGIITYEPYTLAKKAAYYERWLNEWGMKRLGFIHSLILVKGKWLREISDNDVGYSSHYLDAKCFQYAVTGDPKARAEAVNMMKSVVWSEEITPIRGFPARSIYAVGEPCVKSQTSGGGLPAEWHATPDGKWQWKGDTSSDEIDAHVYETNLFLSLVANKSERVWAIEHLRRVIGYIVDCGFCLRDVDGKPTRWGRWDPAYLRTPEGFYARGLNGLEAFNYMTTTYYYTGEKKFLDAKQKLIERNYFHDILKQKLTFPPENYCSFDDRLAFYSYFPLILHETNPKLKVWWLRSLERSWELKRSEGVPWFNFIYGALTGHDCETARAVAHLREWPLDLHKYSYTNSCRDDLYMPKGYRVYDNRTKPLSPRATQPDRWDGDFMRLDGTGGGKVIADPSGWLDAYWMGRYYGMITAPQTKDKSLTTVPYRGLHLGAAPYDGPPRPKLDLGG